MLSVKIFDRKRSFTDLASHADFLFWELQHFYINWLEPVPGQSYQEWIPLFAEILSNFTEILFPSRSLFVNHAYRVFHEMKSRGSVLYPTLQDVFESIMNVRYPAISNMARYRETMLQRLQAVLDHFGDHIYSRRPLDWNAFMRKDFAISLDRLPTDMQNLFIAVLVSKMLLYRIVNDLKCRELEVLIVLDESSTMFRKWMERDQNYLLSDYIARAREFGVGFLIGSQSISNLADTVVANTATKVLVGGFGLGEDYAVFASATGMTTEQREFVKQHNQPGMAFAKDPRWPSVFQFYAPQITR